MNRTQIEDPVSQMCDTGVVVTYTIGGLVAGLSLLL